MACRLGIAGASCAPLGTPVAPEAGACTVADQCANGTTCLSFGSGFSCHRLCRPESIGRCGAGMACSGTFGDPCAQVCRPLPARCNVYAQDCASLTDTCTLVINPETDEHYTGCRAAGTQALGESCGGTAGTCGHALICIRGADGTSRCTPPCDTMGTSPACPWGGTCTGTTASWMVQYCEGSEPPVAGIACGATVCEVGTQACCARFMPGLGHDYRCIPRGDPCSGGGVANCDGPEDCSGGEICCLLIDVFATSPDVICADAAWCGEGSTVGSGFPACHSGDDCDPIRTCCGNTRGFSGSLCEFSCL